MQAMALLFKMLLCDLMQVLNQDSFPNTQLKYWLKKLVVFKASNMCMHVNTLVSLSSKFQSYLNANYS